MRVCARFFIAVVVSVIIIFLAIHIWFDSVEITNDNPCTAYTIETHAHKNTK